MNCYIISYDNKNQDPDVYGALYKKIKGYGTWAHINESVWAVVTSQTAKQIRDELKVIMNPDDSIFVVKSGTEAAWSNVLASSEWLKKNL